MELTKTDSIDYQILKNEAKQGWLQFANAIIQIKDRKLYKIEYSTFEEFCSVELDISKTHANRLVMSAEVIDTLTPIGAVLPQTESQARPLTKLEPELQKEAWAEVVSETKPEAITAQVIAEKVEDKKELNEVLKDVKEENKVSIFNPTPLSDIEILAKAKEIKKENKNALNLDRLDKKKESNEIKELKIVPYDSDMFYKSNEKSESRYGDKITSLKDDTIYTVTTLERFFHRENGIEFSLREYAQVQTFPVKYKFIGTYSTIKKQIGNAVAPDMGRYITKELKGKTIGDLFAGCGGFSCGAHKNGKKSLWAVEWEEPAAMSYKLNNPDTKVLNTNIKGLNPEEFEKVDIIIGGPPCQGFSNAGNNKIIMDTDDKFKDDPRNELYKEFIRFVDAIKPGEFIMENVEEIKHVKDQIISDFNDIGYNVETKLVKGNDIGMKQNRKRFFFIGTKA